MSSEEMMAQILKAVNSLRDDMKEMKAELKAEIREVREENRIRWDANDKKWEENDKRWEENDRRWKENDKRWEENDRRWKEILDQNERNKKEITNILWQYQTSIEEVLRKNNIKMNEHKNIEICR